MCLLEAPFIPWLSQDKFKFFPSCAGQDSLSLSSKC